MNRTSTEHGNESVARLPERQGALDHRAVVLGKLDRARVTEEVGRMKQVHVQRVAFDPFAAVEETAQHAYLWLDLDAEERFECVDSAHLVCDGADTADAGDDVNDL